MGILQLFIVYSLFISSALHVSFAGDTLNPNQNLTHGRTLISSNQIFELGFFNLGNSTDTFLGIWYYNIPLTVVWVANRNSPITNSSGHLVMTSNGVLLLYNGSMGIVWSTNQTVTGENRPVLQLLSSGNLVVRNEDDNSTDYDWESFGSISDTLLPGMKLGWNYRTRTNSYMISWKNSGDPSDGEYTHSLDPPELPQLILRKSRHKEFRWGPYDGDRFSGGRPLRSNGVFTPRFVSNMDGIYVDFQVLDEMTLARFVLTYDGQIQVLTWRSGSSTEWNLLLIINKLYCDRYAMCGPYGNCYEGEPNCHCLTGFTPQSPQDWRVFDSSNGCRRVHELNCSNGDGFVKYDRLKLPDNGVVWDNLSQEGCRTECLRNCDCMAYTFANVYGNGSQCLVWQTKLIDLRDVEEGAVHVYIRVARAELESIAAGKRKAVMITRVVIIMPVLLFILLLALGYWYACRVKRKRTKILDRELELPLFTLDVILAATKKFSSDNKIGQGGFGPVYKGELPNSLEIAVKRLSQDSGQGLQEFKNEVILIAKLQHRNLVKILGCCIEGDEQMLVYEYLSNKSLDRFIYDPLRSDSLPWSKRFSIILGIGRGLLYLHEDSRLTIIHRDLKTSNILLDSDMNPKISDFGIARIFGGEQTEEKTKRVIGTRGYMSPEYMTRGHFSVKSDVFSYGVIVLEIVSGKRNWGFTHPDHDYNLVGHAWKLWNESNCLELADEMGGDLLSVNEVLRCIQVALLCVQNRPKDRPAMSCVVSMLNNEIAELPLPNEPGFCVGTCSMSIASSHNGVNNCTGNAMTFTEIDGR